MKLNGFVLNKPKSKVNLIVNWIKKLLKLIIAPLEFTDKTEGRESRSSVSVFIFINIFLDALFLQGCLWSNEVLCTPALPIGYSVVSQTQRSSVPPECFHPMLSRSKGCWKMRLPLGAAQETACVPRWNTAASSSSTCTRWPLTPLTGQIWTHKGVHLWGKLMSGLALETFYLREGELKSSFIWELEPHVFYSQIVLSIAKLFLSNFLWTILNSWIRFYLKMWFHILRLINNQVIGHLQAFVICLYAFERHL